MFKTPEEPTYKKRYKFRSKKGGVMKSFREAPVAITRIFLITIRKMG